MLKSLLRIYDTKGTMIVEKDVDLIKINTTDLTEETITFFWEESGKTNEVTMSLDGLFITIN